MKINHKAAAGLLALIAIILVSFKVSQLKKLNIVFIGDSITHGARLKDPATQAPPYFATAYLLKHSSGKVQFSNQGVSGFTTVDFLPATATVFNKVLAAADVFAADKDATLVFSIMLGTNDSAITGPHGSPVSPTGYRNNLQIITDSLLKRYPKCKVVVNQPIWYSPNTHNHSTYMQEGLDRLQSYFPEVDTLVRSYKHSTNKNRVFMGDKDAFAYFKANYLTDLQAEAGQSGTFYLHPNEKGAVVLGEYWGKAIYKALQ